MATKNEKWVPIPSFEGLYEVSDLGRIKSLKRKGKKKEIFHLITYDNYGYAKTNLSKEGVLSFVRIHRLVGLLFVENPYPDEYKYLRHLNDNKGDARAVNLKWGTQKQNVADYHGNGLNVYSRSKLTKKQILEIYNSSELPKELASRYNVTSRTIYQIKIGETWKHVTGGNHIPIKKQK